MIIFILIIIFIFIFFHLVACGERHIVPIRFTVPEGGAKFSLELSSQAVIKAVCVGAWIIYKKKVGPSQESPIEVIRTELLEVTKETEERLANWVEEQARNQKAIKELTEAIELKDKELKELKKLVKKKPKLTRGKKTQTPEEIQLQNTIVEQETLLNAYQSNLKMLELDERELACKQLHLKITMHSDKIAIISQELSNFSPEDAEYKRLNRELEEQQLLKSTLQTSYEELDSMDRNIDNDKLEKFTDKIFNINNLPPAQREKVQSIFDEWPSKVEFPDPITYPQYKAVEELTRESEFKQKAWNKGLIKPFLLLVSMHPKDRIFWAKSLKVNLLSMKNYGDAHAEAYKLLTADRKGLQARANHAFADTLNPLGRDCNWYQILHRVCRKALLHSKKVDGMKDEYSEARKSFESSIIYCTTKDDKEICELEELFLKGIMQVMLYLLDESDEVTKHTIIRSMDNVAHTDARRYIQNLTSCGFKDIEVIQFYVVAMIHGGDSFFVNCLLNWAKKKEEGVAVGRIKMVLPVVGMAFSVLLAIPIFLVFGLISPLILLPTSLLAVNTAMHIWRETPGKLLNPLLVILQQEVQLALQGIRVQEFYPNIAPQKDKATQFRNAVSEKTKNTAGKLKYIAQNGANLPELSSAIKSPRQRGIESAPELALLPSSTEWNIDIPSTPAPLPPSDSDEEIDDFEIPSLPPPEPPSEPNLRPKSSGWAITKPKDVGTRRIVSLSNKPVIEDNPNS